MASTEAESQQVYWKSPTWMFALLGAAGLALAWAFRDAIELLIQVWSTSEEYGYGYAIPAIAAFFIWQKKNEIAEIPFTGSWIGALLLLFGGLLLVLGELATLYTVIQYGFVVSLSGLVYALVGWRAFKVLLAPMAVLLFMIPLPGFLYQNLSAELQLISSQIGVAVIRLFGISVYLEGNVIDLGAYKLQVVEACSGLRYLFPLTSLAFIAAYLFRGALWKKAIIFVSSAPITVFMNSFRIGVIGVLVEYGGPGQAEGFLHDFEGWVVFMGCMAILILEMWILAKVGRDSLPFSEAFAVTFPEPLSNADSPFRARSLPMPFKVALPVVVLIAFIPQVLGGRVEQVPQRPSFAEFPMRVGDWQGKRDSLEQIYIDTLKFEDYVIADYRNSQQEPVNFYVAYYGSQRKGESAHSPRSCIPGGGWRIASHERKLVPLQAGSDSAVPINRLLIQKGEYKQLVYYWFQGRGRNITNEYLVKWYIFWDALTRNRTDGALVRLTTFLQPGDDPADGDKRLMAFLKQVADPLRDYIPE